MQYKHIAIEGNIGSGKTTLATMLANDFGARLILEQFSNNPFLPKFYNDPEKHAFPLELTQEGRPLQEEVLLLGHP